MHQPFAGEFAAFVDKHRPAQVAWLSSPALQHREELRARRQRPATDELLKALEAGRARRDLATGARHVVATRPGSMTAPPSPAHLHAVHTKRETTTHLCRAHCRS